MLLESVQAFSRLMLLKFRVQIAREYAPLDLRVR
jgi:hypothetical protein